MADQHPSLHGDDEAEIAQRSADGSDGHHWFKQFVHRVPPGHSFDPDRMDHTANLAGTVQAAVQNGVHPKGDPVFVGCEAHPTAPDNHVLTYAVPVVPAAVDTRAETTLTPTQVTLAAVPPTQ
jgi:hypothetical protein